MRIMLTLLASLFALSVQAQTTFEHLTVYDEWPAFGEAPNLAPNIIVPGEFYCTGGGEPVGLFECTGGHGIHIRGTQMVSCSISDSADWRLDGTVWYDIAANWDESYTGPVSGNWRIVPGDECDPSDLLDPQTYWEGTYTAKRELVLETGMPVKWITTLNLVGYGIGDLAGQKIKATEVITTFTAVPLPWELLPEALTNVIGTGPEGVVDVTIITEY